MLIKENDTSALLTCLIYKNAYKKTALQYWIICNLNLARNFSRIDKRQKNKLLLSLTIRKAIENIDLQKENQNQQGQRITQAYI